MSGAIWIVALPFQGVDGPNFGVNHWMLLTCYQSSSNHFAYIFIRFNCIYWYNLILRFLPLTLKIRSNIDAEMMFDAEDSEIDRFNCWHRDSTVDMRFHCWQKFQVLTMRFLRCWQKIQTLTPRFYWRLEFEILLLTLEICPLNRIYLLLTT
jgi:hypothetical protein